MTTQDFINKINQISQTIGDTENSSEILKNLLLSTLINYHRILAEDPKTKKILESLPLKDITTAEELQSAIAQAKENYKDEPDTLNPDAALAQAQQETLTAYLSELSKTLPPEKYAEVAQLAL